RRGLAFDFALALFLEPGSDRLGLRATATRTATTLAILLTRRLGAAVGAVRVAALGLFFFRTDGRLAARLDDRVSDRLADQLDRADRVVVAGDRHRDQVRIRVRVDDRDDRNAELVGLTDADALLLGVDDEHQPRQPPHVANAIQVLRQLLALAAEHELLLLRV